MAAAPLILLLSLMISLCVSVAAVCEIPIRRSHVLSTWQSSFGDGPTCFYNRSKADEAAVLNNSSASHRFFHSKGISNADSGFHWFAVQLNESVLIRSVTVKGREDSANSTYSRATGIEIWTSHLKKYMFHGEHCSAKDLSKQFNQARDNWRLCGVTKSKQSSINKGEIFTVNCVAEVSHMLLRRNVTGRDSPNDYYMSFADLRLQTVQLNIVVPKIVDEGSNFTVNCSLHCSGTELSTDSTSLHLCSPNGSCTRDHKMEIGSARPQHSGKYTCRLGTVEHQIAVIVLSSSAPQILAENSSLTVSCSLHCSGTELSTYSTQYGNLILCFPNGSCTRDHKMEIGSARPQHSGNYTCRLGTVEHRTAVTVLYPPSNVSISVMKTGSCKSPSDLKVMFASAASHPAAEHRCSADADGIRVHNLTLMSLNTSREGSVSWWSFGVDEDLMLGWNNGTIECRAVQTLPEGIRFQTVHRDSARWSCINGPDNTMIIGFVSGIGFASAVTMIVLGVLTLLGIIKWRLAPHSPTCFGCHAVAMQDSMGTAQVAMVSQCSRAECTKPVTSADVTEYENSDDQLNTASGVYVT